MNINIAHSIRVQNTRDDYFKMSSIIFKNRGSGSYYPSIILMVLSAFIFCGGIDFLTRKHLMPALIANSDTIRMVLWICFYLFLAHTVANILWPKREYIDANGDFLKPYLISIDEKGFYSQSDVKEFFLAWKGVIKLEKDKGYILFYADKFYAYSFPTRSFESSQKANEFYEAALSYWRAAHPTA